MINSTKLNLGCGTDIKPDYVNLDGVPLEGVDIVHNLEIFPYPFEDDTFEEIIAINVLEHLPDTIKVMEELWRISRNGAKVVIRIPYWNSIDFVTDPTHKKLFNEYTFEFFDPLNARCRRRPYYSKARFCILKEYFYIFLPRLGYVKLQNPIAKRFLSALAHYLCNIIRVLEYTFTVVKIIQ